MNSNQSGDELHQHDLHLETLFRTLQLLQELLGKICKHRTPKVIVRKERKGKERRSVRIVVTGRSWLPCGSWMRWMAEKLKTSAFFFFLCFCRNVNKIQRYGTYASTGKEIISSSFLHSGKCDESLVANAWRTHQKEGTWPIYLQDFHRFFQLLLVFGCFLSGGIAHHQISGWRPFFLQVRDHIHIKISSGKNGQFWIL